MLRLKCIKLFFNYQKYFMILTLFLLNNSNYMLKNLMQISQRNILTV